MRTRFIAIIRPNPDDPNPAVVTSLEFVSATAPGASEHQAAAMQRSFLAGVTWLCDELAKLSELPDAENEAGCEKLWAYLRQVPEAVIAAYKAEIEANAAVQFQSKDKES